MDDPVLRVEAVTKDYGERVVSRILHGIDFSLAHGELAALVGPSGSGKSTLLNLVGLLDRPTSGRVSVEGQDTTGLDDARLTSLRGRSIGFVFQFHHLLPEFTAQENVMMPMWADQGYPSREMSEHALDLLRQVGIAEKAFVRTTDLSGGQQQRVAIARALSQKPKLVLADEPTGNLDTQTADEIFALLRRFNREHGTALLLVTHDPRMSARCDRVIELVDGRIVSDRRNDAAG